MSTCFIWGAFLLYALILLWQKMAVNLHAAHKKTDLHAAHKALLACFLLSCANYYSRFTHVHLPLISDYSKIICVQCTKIARLQYTKVDLRAAHFVTCVLWLKSRQKLKNTRMFTTCGCQLRCELYCTYICMYIYQDSQWWVMRPRRSSMHAHLQAYMTTTVSYLHRW